MSDISADVFAEGGLYQSMLFRCLLFRSDGDVGFLQLARMFRRRCSCHYDVKCCIALLLLGFLFVHKDRMFCEGFPIHPNRSIFFFSSSR